MAGRGGVIRPNLIDGGALTTELQDRLSKMVNSVENHLIDAAATATQTSRAVYRSKEIGRPFIQSRPKRATTMGRFEELIDWIPHRVEGGDLVVDADLAKLESGTPTFYGGPGYWLINEIGTGAASSAYIGPHGRYERRYTVKSQVGRAIPFGLVWGQPDGSGARGGRQDQIVPSRLAAGAHGPLKTNPRSRIVIGREIEGKHYLRDGGLAGYTQFRAGALDGAKQAFAGRQRRP